MRRRLLYLACIVCLAVSAGALAAWQRGTRWFGSSEVWVGGRTYAIAWPVGRIVAFSYPVRGQRPPRGYQLVQSPPVNMDQAFGAPTPGSRYRSFAGFGWFRDTGPPPVGTGYGVFAPAWAVALAAAAFPAWWLPRERRRRRAQSRKARGLCPRCGYDLRATPDRCPECGAVDAAGTTSAAPAPQETRPSLM
jgi:hypothetical protein